VSVRSQSTQSLVKSVAECQRWKSVDEEFSEESERCKSVDTEIVVEDSVWTSPEKISAVQPVGGSEL
jgi:hypothetical protein